MKPVKTQEMSRMYGPSGGWSQKNAENAKPSGKRWEARGPDVGKGGPKPRFFPGSSSIFPPLPGISRHFPPFPTSIFLRDEYEDKAHPPAPSHFRGRGRCLLDGVTQGVARGLALPWATYRSPLRGCNVPRCAREIGFMRNKVRIVSRCYAKVHKSSHRSGPWLRDVTHCYGWDSFFNNEARK